MPGLNESGKAQKTDKWIRYHKDDAGNAEIEGRKAMPENSWLIAVARGRERYDFYVLANPVIPGELPLQYVTKIIGGIYSRTVWDGTTNSRNGIDIPPFAGLNAFVEDLAVILHGSRYALKVQEVKR